MEASLRLEGLDNVLNNLADNGHLVRVDVDALDVDEEGRDTALETANNVGAGKGTELVALRNIEGKAAGSRGAGVLVAKGREVLENLGDSLSVKLLADVKTAVAEDLAVVLEVVGVLLEKSEVDLLSLLLATKLEKALGLHLRDLSAGVDDASLEALLHARERVLVVAGLHAELDNVEEDLGLLRTSRAVLLDHALQTVVHADSLLDVAGELMRDHEAEPRAADLRAEEKVVVPDLDGLLVLPGVGRERDSVAENRNIVRVLLARHRKRLSGLVPVAARLGQDTEDMPRNVRSNVLLHGRTRHSLSLLGLGHRRRRSGERKRRVEGKCLERNGF